MALTRQQVVFTYTSSAGGDTYRFDIVVDAQSQVSVRNIQGPQGPLNGSSLPQSVMDDIQEATKVVVVLLSESEAFGGNTTFTGQTRRTVTIPAGVLNNTNYRVAYTTSDGALLTTENPTTTSFDVVAASAYGTPLAPKVVGYSVLTATTQGSSYSGVLTFTDADAGQKSVTFSRALATTAYRVVLSVGGFFVAYTVSKLKTGFTVQLGYTLGVGETVEVGYDVFV
ncbi:MAG: hypothetical protein A2Y38_08220 [Spirochaetes bacterium GWB1_59_5]|nr:MAG: hypothetical protein A2Y38_08220 [Spirochaetes bacterium GWB1_59_5]